MIIIDRPHYLPCGDECPTEEHIHRAKEPAAWPDNIFPPPIVQVPVHKRAQTPRQARTETDLVYQIRDAVLATGRAWVTRNNTGRLKARDRWITYGLGLGSPDLVGHLIPSGRFFCLEVKLPGGRTAADRRENQERWAEARNRAGAFVRQVDSIDAALAAVTEASQ